MYSAQTSSSARNAALSASSVPSGELTLDDLFLAQSVEKLGAGSALFWEGDPASHLFQVVEGCLRLYRIFADGRRAVMGFRFAGEKIGVCCQDLYDYTAEAVTPARLRRISRNRLHAMEEGGADLQPILMAQILEEMQVAQQHIIVLAQLGAEERVAHFLISTALRMGVDPKRQMVVDLPMTRLDMADYLGLTIETVCRALSKLKRDGAISLQGRHRVMFRNFPDLYHLARMADGFGNPIGHSAMSYLPN